MLEIKTILESQSTIQEKMLSSQGVCVWIVWGEVGQPQTAVDILLDAGALNIATVVNQSLWFFFNADVAVNSLAKLDLWGKQFSVGLTAYTFPGSLYVGVDQTKVVEVSHEFWNLKTEPANTRSYIYVHPNYGALAASIPGLSIYEMKGLEQQGSTTWKMITAERRLPFSVEQGWFAFVHPLGNPIDKQFQKGWQTIFRYIEHFIGENKLKYSLQDNFLIIPLENLTLLRSWMRSLAGIIDIMREQHSDAYWPCIHVVLDKNNLNFTPELPFKVNIDWNDLSPDTPYISYKNAFILGDEFVIQDLVYSSVKTNIDSFCTVVLKENNVDLNSFSVLLPEVLVPGKVPCFYCGASNHTSGQCPSRNVEPVSSMYFEQLNDINLTDINSAFREIDIAINKKGTKAYRELIEEEKTAGKLLKAIFAINHVIQLPNLARVWYITNRDIESDVDASQIPESDPNQLLLQRFIKCSPQDMHIFERECIQLLQQNSKNWHIHCILGYILMEKGDLDKAIQFWRDADKLCTVTLHQSWLKYLIGRAREVQGRYADAVEIYQHVMRLLPTWADPQYRILVCDMKRGFTEQVSKQLVEIVNKFPYFFHKVILDPELIRGKAYLLSLLQRFWKDASNKFFVERSALEALHAKILDWFTEETNPIPEQTRNVEHLLKLGEIKNYLLFLDIAKERPLIEAEITEAIDKEVSKLKSDYEKCLFKLEFIRDEMSWFALQKTLTNFNSLFNDCAKTLNWAFGSDFTNPKTFKIASEKLLVLKQQVKELEKKLNVLQMVRDITLFFLLTMRTFVKLAMFFIPLGLVFIFAGLFLGGQMGLGEMQSIVKTNFWALIKVVFSITIMVSLGLASLKTTVIFDRKRRQMIEKAKETREQRQHARVEKARKFRESLEKNSGQKMKAKASAS